MIDTRGISASDLSSLRNLVDIKGISEQVKFWR